MEFFQSQFDWTKSDLCNFWSMRSKMILWVVTNTYEKNMLWLLQKWNKWVIKWTYMYANGLVEHIFLPWQFESYPKITEKIVLFFIIARKLNTFHCILEVWSNRVKVGHICMPMGWRNVFLASKLGIWSKCYGINNLLFSSLSDNWLNFFVF